jgi:hypothetical protein
MYRRNTDAADRMRERRRVEDAAPRLAREVPYLKTLRLSLSFRRGEIKLLDASYVRVVVVPTAPALFDIACADSTCRDGGHQLTEQLLQALRARKTHFSGEVPCRGAAGTSGTACNSVLIYEAEATYE